MRRRYTIISLVLMIFILSACGNNDDGFYRIDGYDTIGIIKDYDKNDNADIITSNVLKKHLPDMTSDIAIGQTEILGEADGKIYAFTIYGEYNKSGTFLYNAELLEINNINDSDYNSLSGPELYLRMNDFLPQSIVEEKKLDTLDWYAYTVGKMQGELKQTAIEYFESEY